ncbi:ATP-binding protein [Pseudomonas aeruginosa]|nr:ATP-binding protein [Pseudomonas aeruginosa]
MLDLTTLNERQRAYLRTIQSSSATLMQLISDVLDVSKIEAGQMALTLAAFNPLDLVREVLGNFAASAMAKDLQFYACIDTEVPAQLIGDVTRIRQVLNNLVNNALKFTDIGRVVLRVKLLSRNDGRALLQWQVADTGIGIAHEQQERLFEAFYQVSGAHHAGGTGLGLSICWHLAEMMGGHLRMVSETGLGSSFSLVLELPEDEQSGLACRPGLLKSACVHVRSPVRELADSVGAWLKAWGCKVSSGEAAPSELETCVLLELLPMAAGPASSPWPGPGCARPWMRLASRSCVRTAGVSACTTWRESARPWRRLWVAISPSKRRQMPAPARGDSTWKCWSPRTTQSTRRCFASNWKSWVVA